MTRHPQGRSSHFGPWATSVSQGGEDPAAAFWLKRLKMLASEPETRARNTQWMLCLGALAAAILFVPVWHDPSVPEVLQESPSMCVETPDHLTNE